MEAMVHLRPAVAEDLIFENRTIENRVYFERSYRTGEFLGPYDIEMADDWLDEIHDKLKLQLLFMPCVQATPTSFSDILSFRPALPEDLKSGKELRYNFCYWLFLNRQLVGPYYLSKKTILNDLKELLDTKTIYVLEHREAQRFPQLNHRKTAS